MSINWAERQRRTNKLVRILAQYVFERGDVEPIHLYGLSKLTWISKSNAPENTSYITSVKIPALSDIFGVDFRSMSLESIEMFVINESSKEELRGLVTSHTGFTKFYNAYRNSVLIWVEEHFDKLLPMYKKSLFMQGADDRIELINGISKLSRIPLQGKASKSMGVEHFLTPTFFSLDPDILFPLINGSDGVKTLLKKLNVKQKSLSVQYEAMTKLIGTNGIDDAADLDQINQDMVDFLSIKGKSAVKGLLKPQLTEEETLKLKDDDDIVSLSAAREINQKRLHNKITNQLTVALSDFTLTEGKDKSCMYDVMVKKFDGKFDLLIEVKSSTEQAHLRMAIGQLFDYSFTLKAQDNRRLSVLLPDKPEVSKMELLEWLNIGCLWFDNTELMTSSKWLLCIAKQG
ncbi:hypothetical protein [Aliivibrio sp. 1S128]|uniref:hypothetical protein n=1 Tax=Aliivibrio sp. 1S128 TaxID=1840085 RepID=UPI00080E206C|nr:hypothetical protein [Aliivibrio sp. 1S128]OCH19809.1 hypothetical protein A6E03_10830 [Aliivibrio sp. 1S128]